jgi:hypothetical protein
MSILQDLEKYRKYKCGICGTKESYIDKTGREKWYKTMVVGEAGFWCSKCYKLVHSQMKEE